MKTIIIVGGGAAGLMAAISASKKNRSVILLDHNDKAGRKLFITGKGRCNITNACPPEEFLGSVVTNSRFLYSAFSRFSNQDMMAFLEEEGLALKTERGLRVFPQSDHSSDVIRTLTGACRRRGVRFEFGCHVEELLFQDLTVAVGEETGGGNTEGTGVRNTAQASSGNTAHASAGIGQASNDQTILQNNLGHKKTGKGKSSRNKGGKGSKGPEKRIAGVRLSDGRTLACDALILACGGASYPATGADGSGYDLARSAGHRITDIQPSLVPFEMEETWCKDLMGLSLRNISIRIKSGKKLVYEGFGEFLFTHFGVSGPLVLTASTRLGPYWKDLKQGKLKLLLDLKPALDYDQLDKRFLREFDTWRNKNISNLMDSLLPKKMIPVFLDLCGIAADKKVRDISKQERKHMEEMMKNLPMQIKSLRNFDEAIITRGGVAVREVDPATMASKKTAGLYLCGEMLDVDAVTGGFNLQIAWTTGYVAGKSCTMEHPE